MDDKVQKIIKDHISSSICLFMKGTKDAPQCGFSAQVVQILTQHGVEYKDVNVLDDFDIREGVKEFTNWPTIPQLYVNGEFVGGCDIIMELERKGELKDLFVDIK